MKISRTRRKVVEVPVEGNRVRSSRYWRCAGLIGVFGIGVLLLWSTRPFVDRSAAGANPVPLPVSAHSLPASVTRRLTHFIENEAVGTDAFIALKDGLVVFEYGPTDRPSNVHSVRKSILSLLFGIAQEKGLVNLASTLKELEIDEPSNVLTAIERSATVEMLLQARSGVYLASGAEHQAMKDGRPARGQYAPGEHFYYNNWDFNVLGAIFEKETGLSIGEALDEWLAQPTGMQDFHPSHVVYDRELKSTIYPTYRIHMSARDLARLGLLIKQQGVWHGRQVVPRDWVRLTTDKTSEVSERAYDGYGYLWWLNSERGVIAADGWGGQYLQIDRSGPYVLVSRQDTGNNRLGYLMFLFPSHYDDPLDVFAMHDILTEGA